MSGAVCLVAAYARQPVRAEGLGSDAGAGAFFSQAVRSAGKRVRESDEAE